MPLLGGYPGPIKQSLIRIEDPETHSLRPPRKEDNFVIREHFRFNYKTLKKMMPRDTKWDFQLLIFAKFIK